MSKRLAKKYNGNKSLKTNDGFTNFTARLGYGADNAMSAGYFSFNFVTKNRIQLEAAYRGNWMAGSVIDCVAEDMTRSGIEITSQMDNSEVQGIQSEISRLGIWNDIGDAIKWSRLYGGAVAVMMIDGQDTTTPLKTDTIAEGQFKGLKVYDRWQLQPDLTRFIKEGADTGLPEFYAVVGAAEGQQIMKVHHSRVIRLVGITLPYWQSIVEMYWGESIIERLYDVLISFNTATLSASNLVSRAHLRTVGIDGLREILAAGGKAEENLITMFEYMRKLQTNEGITLLDKNDNFNTTAYSFAGLSDIILQFGQQISGATQIPLTRLFGQSPAGLNSTGESDMRTYYDGINAKQENMLRDGMHKVLKVIYRSKYGKSLPEDFNFTFASLWQMTNKEKSEVAKNTSDNINATYTSGIIDRGLALQELKSSSALTGIYTNITDEMIEEASAQPPLPTVEDKPTNEAE